MNVHYVVELTPTERGDLEAVVASGTTRARTLKRAQVLLAADAGVADRIIAGTVGVGPATIYRTRRRFVERGLERALHDDPRPGAGRKLTAKDEALLVAVACSKPGSNLACMGTFLLRAPVLRPAWSGRQRRSTEVYTRAPGSGPSSPAVLSGAS